VQFDLNRLILSVELSTYRINCRFRLTQTWCRKIHELGLSTQNIKETGGFKDYIGMDIFRYPREVSESFSGNLMSIKYRKGQHIIVIILNI